MQRYSGGPIWNKMCQNVVQTNNNISSKMIFRVQPREEGVLLVNKFDHEFPERFSNEIYKYLSINEKEFPVASKAFEEPIFTKDYFLKLCDKFRSPHIWKYNDGKWILRNRIK